MFNIIKKIIPRSVKEMVVSKLHDNDFRRAPDRDPVDLREVISDPLHGFMIAKKAPFLMDVPIEYCRSIRGLGFDCSPFSASPFIMGLSEYVRNQDPDAVTYYLSNFYEMVVPRNVGELMGLKITSDNNCFKLSPLCYEYPWNGFPRSSLYKKRKRIINEESARHVAAKYCSGWHHFGPVSDEKLKLEVSRLISISNRIGTDGYQRDDSKDGDILGVVLSRGEEYRVIIKQGHHRIAALAALGYKTVTIRFGVNAVSFVRRHDVNHWAGIRSGGYSVEEALSVFDRLFAGRQPEICDQWMHFLNDQTSCKVPDGIGSTSQISS